MNLIKKLKLVRNARVLHVEQYQQAFCKSRSGTKCKDKYWNTVDPNKRNNTTRISPASTKWLVRKEAQRWENMRNYIESQEHPFSSEALGQD
jgi:hypothetical protein